MSKNLTFGIWMLFVAGVVLPVAGIALAQDATPPPAAPPAAADTSPSQARAARLAKLVYRLLYEIPSREHAEAWHDEADATLKEMGCLEEMP